MVQVISTQNISTEGNGREDYSTSLDASSIPVIRAEQQLVEGTITFTVPANTSFSYILLLLNISHHFYDMYISCSANVLLEAYLYDRNGTIILDHLGYNHIDLKIPCGLPLDYLQMYVTNWGNVNVEVTFTYHGLVGGDIVYLE
jgi:hypothetical protein